MTIIPDLETAILMTIPFLVTYVALHFILFKPLYAFLQERDQAVETARSEAAELTDQIEERMDTIDGKLSRARDEVAELRAEARSQAQEKESAILEQARDASDQKVAAAVEEIQEAQQTAAKSLRDTAGTLSHDIANQVLGREVQA